jgi:hypothetical protein
MEILSGEFPASLSPSSMDPRPASPDDPRALQVLPGSQPDSGRDAGDAAHSETLAIGWPPQLAREPVDPPGAAAGGGWSFTPSASPADVPPVPAGQPRDPQTGRWVEL